jgi:hypothetical protein
MSKTAGLRLNAGSQVVASSARDLSTSAENQGLLLQLPKRGTRLILMRSRRAIPISVHSYSDRTLTFPKRKG